MGIKNGFVSFQHVNDSPTAFVLVFREFELRWKRTPFFSCFLCSVCLFCCLWHRCCIVRVTRWRSIYMWYPFNVTSTLPYRNVYIFVFFNLLERDTWSWIPIRYIEQAIFVIEKKEKMILTTASKMKELFIYAIRFVSLTSVQSDRLSDCTVCVCVCLSKSYGFEGVDLTVTVSCCWMNRRRIAAVAVIKIFTVFWILFVINLSFLPPVWWFYLIIYTLCFHVFT